MFENDQNKPLLKQQQQKVWASQLYNTYLLFKKQLLTNMITNDPLSILESDIFQRFQTQFKGILTAISSCHLDTITTISNNSRTKKKTDMKINANRQIEDRQILMQTKICDYMFDGVNVGVVERRSFSCGEERMCRSQGERALRNKLRRQQEQHQVDLVIFSNIMNNHFGKQNKTIFHRNIPREQTKQNNKNSENKLQQNINVGKNRKQKQKQDENRERKRNKNWGSVVVDIIEKIMGKEGKGKIREAIQQIDCRIWEQIDKIICQQNSKIIVQLKELRKQNDRLLKTVKQNSMKQLQHIVQLKHWQKKHTQKDKQILYLTEQLTKMQYQKTDKQSSYALNRTTQPHSRNPGLNLSSGQKSHIQQLKQRIAIDSIRRTTLCTLNKEKIGIELQKQELGLFMGYNLQGSSGVGLNARYGNSNGNMFGASFYDFRGGLVRDDYSNSQETREDQE